MSYSGRVFLEAEFVQQQQQQQQSRRTISKQASELAGWLALSAIVFTELIDLIK